MNPQHLPDLGTQKVFVAQIGFPTHHNQHNIRVMESASWETE
jgi:hypothetical protein